jgi:hypothetical protein
LTVPCSPGTASASTLEELSELKFDEMDLSEFLADIEPTKKVDSFLQDAINRSTNQVKSYYEEGLSP